MLQPSSVRHEVQAPFMMMSESNSTFLQSAVLLSDKTQNPDIAYMGHIAYNVVAPVIISFGILTNLLNLLVLTRPTLRGPTYRYLKGLAVANLLVCVVLLPFTLHSHSSPVPFIAAFYFAHIEVPLGNALIAASVYIVIGLSIDRFVAVCYPRKYRRLHSHHVANVRIFLSFVIAFILYIPLCLSKKVTLAGSKLYVPQENLDIVETRWFMIYNLGKEICVRFAPAVCLAILNICIIFKFKKISKRRRLLSKGIGAAETSNFPSQSFAETVPVQPSINVQNPTNNSNGGSGSIQPEGPIEMLTTESATPAPDGDPSVVMTSTSFITTPDYSVSANNTSPDDLSTCQLVYGRHSTPLNKEGVAEALAKRPSEEGKEIAKCHNNNVNSEITNEDSNQDIVPTRSSLTNSARKKKILSERRHELERRLILLLLSIIIAFFITNIPTAILSLTIRDEKLNDLNFQIFRAIANNLEFLNFGLNFILYFLFSKDIRTAFVNMTRGAFRNVANRFRTFCLKTAS